MDFTIYSSSGNLLASFKDLSEARRAMAAAIAEEPEAVDHMAIVCYDDEGEAVEAVFPDPAGVPPRFTTLNDASVDIMDTSTVAFRSGLQDLTMYFPDVASEGASLPAPDTGQRTSAVRDAVVLPEG
jgi:hypothetical protein